MQARTIDLDGPVHYLDYGGTGHPLVLVHGLGGSALNWSSVAPALTGFGRVLVPDLAGFGRTPPAGRPTTVAANRALLDRFIERVAGGRAVLVGNSMGGMISLLEAETNPDRVAGLVLVNSTLPVPVGAPVDRQVLAVFSLYLLPVLGPLVIRRRLATHPPELAVREMMALCAADLSTIAPEAIEAHVALARERAAMPWVADALIAAARSVLRTAAARERLRAQLRAVRAPTLMIHGTRDRLVPFVAAEAAAQVRPDWSFVPFEEVGHVPQLEAPARFVDTVGRWLPRVS